MADAEEVKLSSEESGDATAAAGEEEQVSPPEEQVAAEGASESAPKENGTTENAADSNDGEQPEEDEPPVTANDLEDRPNLKRSSTDVLDVPGADTVEVSSPEKRAKVDEHDDSSKDEN